MRLLYNGKFHKCSPDVTALAINNGIIEATGSDAEILNLAARGVEKIDLGGRYVLPGITDSHLHLDLYGASLTKVFCATDTRKESLARVQIKAQELPPEAWLLGHGWNQNTWEGVFGTANDLDEVAPNHPVYLTHVSLHSAWVNTRALELAGINLSTPDPEGGIIQRDPKGNPTGILFESAMDLVEQVIPSLTKEERKHNLLAAQEKLMRFGITAVHDFDRIPCFSALQELDQERKLILRVFKSLPFEKLAEAVAIGLKTDFGSPHLRVGPVKLFADGALGPQTAAMLSPYEGSSDNYGGLLLSADEIFETGVQASKSGLSLAIHAIGDRATQEVLQGFNRLRKFERDNHLPRLRHRIEHLQLLSPENLALVAKLKLCASMQPVHLYMDMQTADRHWGARSRYAYAFASLISHGTDVIFGSDAPVESPNPFLGIHAAVARSQYSPHSTSWYPEEKINLAAAINAYTLEPAKQAGLKGMLGELAAGRFADLVVMDRNPFGVQPDELHTLKPVMVMVEGSRIFQTF